MPGRTTICAFWVVALAQFVFAVPSLHFTRDDNEEFDPHDHSDITKFAALGDSYSAGIGAGERLGQWYAPSNIVDDQSDFACSRYDHAYPYLINTDARLGDPAKRKFQFLSCSGAKSQDVLDLQVPKLENGQQVITLSIGGNDADLTELLNQCIFQFAVLNKGQTTAVKVAEVLNPEDMEWAAEIDWDPLSRGCAAQLDHSERLILDKVPGKLKSVIDAVKPKLASGGMLYVTGYGKFFAEDMSKDCDKVSWSTWLSRSAGLFHEWEYLAWFKRERMNKLVDLMNQQLERAIKEAGSSVKFVNYDQYIGRLHGRFCEAGVDESTSASNTRTGLMFYEMSTWDALGQTPWKRTTSDTPPRTFEGQLQIYAQIAKAADPEIQFRHQDKVKDDGSAAQMSQLAGVGVKAGSDAIKKRVPNILPDGYDRIFHPQILLHQLIANLVIFEMTNHKAVARGNLAVPEQQVIGNTCPSQWTSGFRSCENDGDCTILPICAGEFVSGKPRCHLPTKTCRCMLRQNPVPKPKPKPIEPPTREQRVCHPRHNHWDVDARQQEVWSIGSCDAWHRDGRALKKGGPGIPTVNALNFMMYEISWIEGCDKTGTEQDFFNPFNIEETKVSERSLKERCEGWMYGNYAQCDNGGAGGYLDVGCIRYNFYVT